jgi:uncharacterized membrane protein (UPF0127 family)
MLRILWAFVALFTVSLTTDFVPSASSQVAFGQGQPMILPVDPEALVIDSATGVHRFTIEVADTDDARSAGLMFRQDMDDDHGMLFVFEQTRRLSFWMQNTPMPLDLIFIDEDGRIVSIRWGKPFSTASIGPLSPARFVLELKAGTAQNAGITEGDRVRHPQIDAVAAAK